MQSTPIRPLTYARFSLGHTIGGWEVLDKDGRSVTPEYPSQSIAMTVKDALNAAASSGHRALARALGATDNPLEVIL